MREIAVSSTRSYVLYYSPDPTEILEWLRKRDVWLGHPDDARTVTAFGVLELGDGCGIEAAACLYDFTQFNVEICVASNSPKPWRRKFIRYMFDYIYKTMGVTRVTARVAEDNQDSVKLIEGIGFTEEGTLRKFRHDVDYKIYGMLRDECKWISDDKMRKAA